jgi:hypothetical protein
MNPPVPLAKKGFEDLISLHVVKSPLVLFDIAGNPLSQRARKTARNLSLAKEKSYQSRA